MNKIKVAIIEWDSNFRMYLQSTMENFTCFEIIGSFSNTEEFTKSININELDCIFTNFSFNNNGQGSDGTYLTQYVRNNQNNITIVFISENKEDAYKAFQHEAFDFLLKPFDIDRASRILLRLRKYYEDRGFFTEKNSINFLIKTKFGYQMIHTDKILYIELINRKCIFHMEGNNIIVLSGYSMSTLEKKLTIYGFFRCYQSLIVNLAKVNSVHADNKNKWYTIKVEGYNGEVPLSREKYNELLVLLKSKYEDFSS